MTVLNLLLFLFLNLNEDSFRKNCDYKGWGDYIKDKSGYEWVYYTYLLEKGEFENAAMQEQKLKERKIKKEDEIKILKEFYINKNYKKVCEIARKYLNKKDGKFNIKESLAFLYSAIIMNDKEIVELLLEKKIIKMGFPYLMATYLEMITQLLFIPIELLI